MARRLCFEERVRIEAMAQAAVGAAEAARRLGRHRVTVQRELRRNGVPGGYGRVCNSLQLPRTPCSAFANGNSHHSALPSFCIR